MKQTNLTTVRVSWTASLTVSVVGYRVHFSLSGGRETITGITTSTSTDITGLTNGETYNFSVAATAGVHILPGVSGERNITLGELLNVR